MQPPAEQLVIPVGAGFRNLQWLPVMQLGDDGVVHVCLVFDETLRPVRSRVTTNHSYPGKTRSR